MNDSRFMNNLRNDLFTPPVCSDANWQELKMEIQDAINTRRAYDELFGELKGKHSTALGPARFSKSLGALEKYAVAITQLLRVKAEFGGSLERNECEIAIRTIACLISDLKLDFVDYTKKYKVPRKDGNQYCSNKESDIYTNLEYDLVSTIKKFSIFNVDESIRASIPIIVYLESGRYIPSSDYDVFYSRTSKQYYTQLKNVKKSAGTRPGGPIFVLYYDLLKAFCEIDWAKIRRNTGNQKFPELPLI